MVVYSYDRRAKALVNPQEALVGLYRLLAQFGQNADNPYKAAAFLRLLPRYQVALKVREFFSDLLQTYKAAPKDQKILEKAAQEFNKVRTRIGKDPAADLLKKYQLYKSFYEAAERTIKSAKPLTDEEDETLKAGSFTLVNTGGFNDKVMANVADLVKESEKLLRAKGFGRVCYGEVNVTGTIAKSRTLAHYTLTNDELFIRANIKKGGLALRTIIHELAHRLQYKFMGGDSNKDIRRIFLELSGKTRRLMDSARWDRSRWPSPRDTIQAGRKTYQVEEVKPNSRHEMQIELTDPSKPQWRGTLPLDAYLRDKFPESTSAFVTQYAATKPEENFAEMVAFYCLGQLPVDQEELLKSVL